MLILFTIRIFCGLITGGSITGGSITVGSLSKVGSFTSDSFSVPFGAAGTDSFLLTCRVGVLTSRVCILIS